MVLLSGSAGQHFRARYRWLFGLDLGAKRPGFLSTVREVGAHLIPVMKVETNHGINVAEFQCVVCTNDIFRFKAVLVTFDDDVKSDARLTDADDSPFLFVEWERILMDYLHRFAKLLLHFRRLR
jgi:hypothetical protein